VECPSDLAWAAERVPEADLHAALETAAGVLNAATIAASPHCSGLSIGGVDLRRDLGLGEGHTPMLWARSSTVMVARAAGLPPPVDSVFPYLDDDAGLKREAEHARALGLFGKAAIHPRQLPAINRAFSPSPAEIGWAQEVLRAARESDGAATTTEFGELVDVPVIARAESILMLASSTPSSSGLQPCRVERPDREMT
jgi:citrate lyase subunit beta/citryl-CoA lyase